MRASRGRIRMLVSSSLATLLLLLVPATVARANLPTVNYNRTAAVSYADQYSCNPPYTCRNSSYSSFGSDCTNFVSQAFHAGGVAYDDWLSGGVSPWKPYTDSWINVTGFLDFWSWHNAYSGLILEDKTSSYTSAVKGDLYAYDWGGGDGISHLAMEAGWGARPSAYAADGSGDYVDQHTTDRFHSPWNYGYLHAPSTQDRSKMKFYRVPLKDSFDPTNP